MADTVVIHTNEIVLKGGNRAQFERRLVEIVRQRIAHLASFRIRRSQSGIYVAHDGPMSEAVRKGVVRELSRIFGIAHFTLAVSCGSDMESIRRVAQEMLGEGTAFRVTTRRSDKRFPLRSMEVNREVGGHLLANVKGTRVDLHAPEAEVKIEITDLGTFVSCGRTEGRGGLPTGASGPALALLSGGIDSPVAAWKIMKRGCPVSLIHFHSYPHVGKESLDKVRRLAGVLAGFQGDTILHLVPFGDIQQRIVAGCDERYRVVLYRRMMLRIAEHVAREGKAFALVTGDSVGQVSSQTLENMNSVSAATALPVFRPLIGDDKEEIVTVARSIGTYDISIEPHDDCCSLFMPKNPVIRSRLRDVLAEEAKLDADMLLKGALGAIETERVAWSPAA